MKKITKALVPAAGLGTRFLPYTKSIPKEMIPIIDRPTIEYIIKEIVDSGITDILLINGRHKVSMIDYFDRSPEIEEALEGKGKGEDYEMITEISELANIYSLRQKNPLGLGHAILCGKNFIGKNYFAVLLGDDVIYNKKDPALDQMLSIYERTGSPVIGVQRVPWELTSQYGIVETEETNDGLKITRMTEKPKNSSSNLAIIGRYILPPEIFTILEKTPKGVGGEIQLTDALEELLKTRDIYACLLKGRRYDLGSKEGFLEATVETALRRDDLKEAFLAYLKSLNYDQFG